MKKYEGKMKEYQGFPHISTHFFFPLLYKPWDVENFRAVVDGREGGVLKDYR